MRPWNPHPYQLRGISTLTKQCGAGMLLDPGMGKTAVALAAFEVLRSAGYAFKMLVVTPIKPLYDTWPKEMDKWEDFSSLKWISLHGKFKEMHLAADADVYLINPEGLVWLYEQKDLPCWEVLCIDESTKFKSSKAKRFKLLKKHLPDFYYRWIMTGTITPQGLIDLFAQVLIMDEGHHLGKYITHYRNNYFYSTGYGGYTYKPVEGAVETITEKIAHMVLRLNAEDYLDMPEFNRILRPVTLPALAMSKYKEIEKEFITQIKEKTIVAANVAAAGTKCRQIANGAVYYDDDGNWEMVHDAKMDALDEIIEETLGHPLFILYEFKHDRERIMEKLGKDARCITGMTGTKLTSVIDMFNRGDLRYLVAHPGSIHGLNIQGYCYHMVWFGVTWNLEHYIQAIWRLYRQGQSATMVLCYILVATGTLDEKVVKVLDHKKANQTEIEESLMCLNPI